VPDADDCAHRNAYVVSETKTEITHYCPDCGRSDTQKK